MTIGQVPFFNQFQVDLGNEIHSLNADTFKLGLITDVVTPVVTAALPHFGGTGTINYATNEVTPGGNYAAGGVTLTSVSWADTAGTTNLNAAKVSIAQHASNPTNARWGILYNDTIASKRALAWVDLGSIRDLTAGPFEIKWNAVDGTGSIAALTSTPN